MKIGILSYRSKLFEFAEEELRIQNELNALNADVLNLNADLFRFADCALSMNGGISNILINGEFTEHFDVIVPRASFLNKINEHLFLIEQFESNGTKTLNSAKSIAFAKNKIKTMQILNATQIPIIKTSVISSYEALDSFLEDSEESKFILKNPFGTFGSGVVLAESKKSARSVLDAIWKGSPSSFMIQTFIEESNGADFRIFVINGEAVAGMQRQAKHDEFRSNIELGASSQPIVITKELEDLAVKSARALELDIAGVDIIQTKNGYAVLEVNANPGFKNIEATTGVNIAKKIAELAVASAKASPVRK